VPDEDDTAGASGDPAWPIVDKSSMYGQPQAPGYPPAYGHQYGQPQYRPPDAHAGASPRAGRSRALVLLVALAVILLLADVVLLVLWLLNR
jgi:hypothetical protein